MKIRELNGTHVKEKNILVLATADVVTSYGNIHYVITEYDISPLFGKCIKEKAQGLFKISHLKFRDELTKYAKDTYKI